MEHWYCEKIADIVYTCIILHNAMHASRLEDESGEVDDFWDFILFVDKNVPGYGDDNDNKNLPPFDDDKIAIAERQEQQKQQNDFLNKISTGKFGQKIVLTLLRFSDKTRKGTLVCYQNNLSL